jgi:hypothetical protein
MFDIDKKFIFTHPPKSGGTSIESLLGFFTKEKRYDQRQYKHKSLSEQIAVINESGYSSEDFFKFSITRNPWDRMVSYYYFDFNIQESWWIKKHPGVPLPDYIKQILKMNFEDYVKYRCGIIQKKSFSAKRFMFHQDKYALDYCIRFENIVEDTKIVMNKLGIEYKEMPHRNNSISYKPQKHYSEFYNEEARDLVASAFIDDIEFFGYEFESK